MTISVELPAEFHLDTIISAWESPPATWDGRKLPVPDDAELDSFRVHSNSRT